MHRHRGDTALTAGPIAHQLSNRSRLFAQIARLLPKRFCKTLNVFTQVGERACECMRLSVPLSAIGAAVFVHMLWGGNPVAVKFSLTTFPPMWTAFFRFVLGIACVCVWAAVTHTRVWPERHEWPWLALLGLLFGVQIGSMNIGFDLSTASTASVLIATNPLFSALFAHFAIKDDRMHTRKAIGLVSAFCGVVLVLIPALSATAEVGSLWGSAIVLLSATLLGGRLVYAARLLQSIDPVRVVIWQMAIALPGFALIGALTESIQWQNFGWPVVAGIAYQGILIAGLGFTVMSYLVKRYPPSIMLSFNFVSPVTGVLLGAWLLDEVVSGWTMAGVALVGGGLYLIAKRQT